MTKTITAAIGLAAAGLAFSPAIAVEPEPVIDAAACEQKGAVGLWTLDGSFLCLDEGLIYGAITPASDASVTDDLEELPVIDPGSVKDRTHWTERDAQICDETGGQTIGVTGDRVICAPK